MKYEQICMQMTEEEINTLLSNFMDDIWSALKYNEDPNTKVSEVLTSALKDSGVISYASEASFGPDKPLWLWFIEDVLENVDIYITKEH